MRLYHGSANIKRNLAKFDGFDLSHRPNGTRRVSTGIDSLGVWATPSRADAAVFARSTDDDGVIVEIDFTPKSPAVFTRASFDKWVDAEAKRQRKQRYNMDTTALRAQLEANGSNCVRIEDGGKDDPVPDGADYWIILDPKDARVVNTTQNDVVERINGLLSERAGDGPRAAAAGRMLLKLRKYLSEMLGVAEVESERARAAYAALDAEPETSDSDVQDSRDAKRSEVVNGLYHVLRRRGLMFPQTDPWANELAAGVDEFLLAVTYNSKLKPVPDKDERRKLSPLMFGFGLRLTVGGYFHDRRPSTSLIALQIPWFVPNTDQFEQPVEAIRRVLAALAPYEFAASSFIHEYTHYLDAMYTNTAEWQSGTRASADAGWKLKAGSDEERKAARRTYYVGAHEVNARITELYRAVQLAVRNTAPSVQSRLKEQGFDKKSASEFPSYLSEFTPFKDEKNPTHYAALSILNTIRLRYPLALPKVFANQYADTIVPSDVLDLPENAKLRRKILTRLTQLAVESMSWVAAQAKRISANVVRDSDTSLNGVHYGMRDKGASSRRNVAAGSDEQ